MKRAHAGCCGDLHMTGPKGFSNSKADRVADGHVKGHYGGPEGGDSEESPAHEARESKAEERRENRGREED